VTGTDQPLGLEDRKVIARALLYKAPQSKAGTHKSVAVMYELGRATPSPSL
jgi:hypothetical protein